MRSHPRGERKHSRTQACHLHKKNLASQGAAQVIRIRCIEFTAYKAFPVLCQGQSLSYCVCVRSGNRYLMCAITLLAAAVCGQGFNSLYRTVVVSPLILNISTGGTGGLPLSSTTVLHTVLNAKC